MSDSQIIQRLREELHTANEHIRQLIETFSGREWWPPLCLHLTQREMEILRVLVRRTELVTFRQLAAMLEARDIAAEVNGEALLKVYICKLRAKLAPHDLQIETHWGAGYRLPDATRHRLLDWDGATGAPHGAIEVEQDDMRKTCAADYPDDLRTMVVQWKREGVSRADIIDLIKERWPGRFDWMRQHHIDVLTATQPREFPEVSRRGRPGQAPPAAKRQTPSLGGPVWSHKKAMT